MANGEFSSEAVADQHMREPSHESQLFPGKSSRTAAHLQAAPALLAKAPELDHRNFKEEFLLHLRADFPRCSWHVISHGDGKKQRRNGLNSY